MNRQQPRLANSGQRSGGLGFRRGALLALVVVLGLVVPVVAAGAEPKTTPVSEPPGTTPTTAAPLCTRISCGPIGRLTVDPDQGLPATEINTSGNCGRSLSAADRPAISLSVRGPRSQVSGVVGPAGGGSDFSRGTFVIMPITMDLARRTSGMAFPPDLYYFIVECVYNPAEDVLVHVSSTRPATFCLYEADNDPAGCTSTPTFADLAHQLDAWGFFSGHFIEQIGAQFTPLAAPAPAPPAPDVTTTTRRPTTQTVPAVVVPPPPPPPEVTTTTTLKPCVGKGCP